MNVTVTVTCEMERQATYELDLDEFREWCGEEPTPELVKEFIYSGRDADDVLERLWRKGKDPHAFSTVMPVTPDIESVVFDDEV